MKTLFLAVFCLLAFVTSADPIPRIPRVSVEFAKRMTALDTNNCVRVEGQWSDPASSINKKPDYFIVGSVNDDRARALHMGPFKTDPNGVE